MARKMKVYRTPIGFHDAYVAAPSQKAALEAWGSEANLFARGMAEIVDDPNLVAAPLANPGKVIKLARGTTAEYLKALPRDPARTRTKTIVAEAPPPAPRRSPQPKPSRQKLEAAQHALTELEQRQEQDEREQAAEERRLADRRRKMERDHEKERSKLARTVEDARSAYEDALQQWDPEG